MLLAYTKITAAEELIATDLPDEPYMQDLAVRLLPAGAAERYPEAIAGHPLRREIITTVLVNDTVNTRRYRPSCTGCGRRPAPRIEEIVRAQIAARAIFGLGQVWDAVEELDNKVRGRCSDPYPAALPPTGRAGYALAARNRPQPLQLSETIDFFTEDVAQVRSELPKLLQAARFGVVPAHVR